VVSAGQHVDSHFQEFFSKPRRDSESRCRIFAIGNDQINLPMGNDVREAIANDLPPGRADDVSHEKYAHALFQRPEHKNGADRLAVGS
jgi:hypothetical protein